MSEQPNRMIELRSEIPFLWRLSAKSSEGYCSVSMVVPCPPETEISDLTIETSVLSMPSDSRRSEQEETLEWNQEDISLFLRLINQRQFDKTRILSDTVRVDLTDPEVIDIIHVVAAAGFGMAFASSGFLNEADGAYPMHDFEVGSFASLDTVRGFVRCVVVDVDGDEVVCVLLDDIYVNSPDEAERLCRHDLVLVRHNDVLHPEFADTSVRSNSTTLH